jgi:hypothetical protein
MAERIKELKPSEYHTTRNMKILSAGSGALIGGAIGLDIVFRRSGINTELAKNLPDLLFFSGGAPGLAGLFEMFFQSGKASVEEKK